MQSSTPSQNTRTVSGLQFDAPGTRERTLIAGGGPGSAVSHSERLARRCPGALRTRCALDVGPVFNFSGGYGVWERQGTRCRLPQQPSFVCVRLGDSRAAPHQRSTGHGPRGTSAPQGDLSAAWVHHHWYGGQQDKARHSPRENQAPPSRTLARSRELALALAPGAVGVASPWNGS